MRRTIATLLAAAGVSAALMLGAVGVGHAEDPVTGLLGKVVSVSNTSSVPNVLKGVGG